MIEVIKAGDLSLAEKKIRFDCDNCGCVFTASKADYTYCGDQREGDEWYSWCPTCHKKVYSHKKVGW